MLISQLLSSVAGYTTSLQGVLTGGMAANSFPSFAFSEDWRVVGPFQIGTRAWGADPLEYEGGFHRGHYTPNATFKSSLAPNATVHWSNVTAKRASPSHGEATAELTIGFPDIPWRRLQDIYGWAALQWQGWARGSIIVHGDEKKVLRLDTDNVLEYWIDNVHYFGGDFYAFRKAPVTLRLEPGIHTMDVRLIREVRAMGGVGAPDLTINLSLENTCEALRPARWAKDVILLPDVIRGYYGGLATTAASASLRNDGVEDVFVTGVEAMPNMCISGMVSKVPVKLVPGQTRPIAFKLDCIPPLAGGPPYYGEYWADFKYHTASSQKEQTLRLDNWQFKHRDTHEPHKITFMHPGGMVSYAILRPPSPKADCSKYAGKPLPVLLALHGAGVEADSEELRHSLDAVPDLCAWVLFPTGVTPWSGDDWHIWGFADVEAAVAAIPGWIEHNDWKGPGVDINRWFVMGHSNGGQGAWYALTHHPDKVIAAAPLSGYSSIQNYVPYTLWHPAEPERTNLREAALNNYKHELLLENAKGIPIYQQHGDLDDNVPPYHSRLLHSQLHEVGIESQYIEIPGMPHWWDGIMTTPTLTDFFHKHLDASLEAEDPVTELQDFTLVTASPNDTSSKGGFRILQLRDPGKMGRMAVQYDPLTKVCTLSPNANILSLELPRTSSCVTYTLNAQPIVPPPSRILLRTPNGTFTEPSSLPPRQNRQLGPGIDAILRTHGPLNIVTPTRSNLTSHLALQISRNLAQYYNADTVLEASYAVALTAPGNIITLTVGAGSDLPSPYPETPSPGISVTNTGITITAPGAEPHTYGLDSHASSPHEAHGSRAGLAALWLRPLAHERLELVLWAADAGDLELVARLVPLMAGTGVPDWAVLDARCGWKGLGGVRAGGWFDSRWEVAGSSFFT